jgi:hypothetical protein
VDINVLEKPVASIFRVEVDTLLLYKHVTGIHGIVKSDKLCLFNMNGAQEMVT